MADEEAGRERPELDLPPTDFGRHLVDFLYKIGPSTGGEVVTYQELLAYRHSTGVALNAWEATTLRRMSDAYLGELHAAVDPNRPPPAGVARKAAAAAIMNMINFMMAPYEEAPSENPSPAPAGGRPTPKRSPQEPAERARRAAGRSRGQSPPE